MTRDAMQIWLMPAILSGMLAFMGWIAVSLNEISQTTAVAMSKIQDHDRRLDRLEMQK